MGKRKKTGEKRKASERVEWRGKRRERKREEAMEGG